LPANPEARWLEHLPQHDEAAAQALDQRPGGFVNERRGDKRRGVGAGRGPEQQDPAAKPEKRLDAVQQFLLHTHGPDADQVLGFVQLRPCQEILRPDGLDRGVGQVEVAGRFPKKRGLSGLGFHHHQLQRRNRDLQGNGRRPPAGPDVEQAGMRSKMGAVDMSVSMRAVEVARCNQRLDEQPVDRLVWGVLQRERGEIDFLIPELEEAVVGRQ